MSSTSACCNTGEPFLSERHMEDGYRGDGKDYTSSRFHLSNQQRLSPWGLSVSLWRWILLAPFCFQRNEALWDSSLAQWYTISKEPQDTAKGLASAPWPLSHHATVSCGTKPQQLLVPVFIVQECSSKGNTPLIHGNLQGSPKSDLLFYGFFLSNLPAYNESKKTYIYTHALHDSISSELGSLFH